MIYAYDLDGVLAQGPPASPKPWRKMNGVERKAFIASTLKFYETAPPLFTPPKEVQFFHVITARKREARDVTLAWLTKRFKQRLSGLHMLDKSRSIENVVRFKAGVLRDVSATDYAEDNRTVVRELRKLDLPCRIWHFKKGRMVLDYEAPL